VLRACGALDETGLLEIDGDDTGELFTTMRWYASDPEAQALSERYHRRWGAHAPSLGVYAAGCYEGVHHLARLAGTRPLRVAAAADSAAYRFEPGRPRLARADGLDLLPVG
jgi:ABC-type branched-subunit amino acid transport system substrate-binding protein